MKTKRIPANELEGKPTKEEKKALKLLRNWYNDAEKKKDFSGVLERGGCGGYPQKGGEAPGEALWKSRLIEHLVILAGISFLGSFSP